MRPRIPLAYASLLIIALVAVIGFAAFSPSSDAPIEDTTVDSADTTSDVRTSARVASAVLALRVSDAESRTATTTAATDTSSTTDATRITEDAVVGTADEEPTSSSTPPTTEPAATSAPATTSTQSADTTPPAIRITSPHDGDTVDDRVITFRGTTERGATVSSGPYAADVSDDGTWTIQLVLAPGPNGASITSRDDAGNEASIRIVVYYEPTATTTTTKAPSTTTTKAPSTTTTTSGSSSSQWSPQWPADSGGARNVENWRSTVAQYWPDNRVDCVLGIIKRESNGNPRAYNSSSNAEGLLQHLHKYWRSRATGAGFIDGNGLVASPYNGQANIAAGAYLANWADSNQSAWWWPWQSGGSFTANYGSCQGSNPP